MRKLFTGLALCLALVLVGCGGSDATPTVPAPNPTAATGNAAATSTTGTVSQATTPATSATTGNAAATSTSGTVSQAATPAGSTANNGQLTHVVLATGFIPNVQNAPFYVAQDKGYYAAEGLDVEIKYGQVANLQQLVSDGSIEFSAATGDSLIPARLAGANIRYVMAIFQKYPVGALAIAGNGAPLKTAADLKGRTVGISGPNSATYIGLRALLKEANLTENDVKVISIGFTENEALIQKRIDVAMTYLSNEQVQLKSMGYQVETVSPSGINLISNGIATGDKTIAERPQIVQAFVRATQKGLADTIKDPDGTLAISLKRIPDISPDKVPAQADVLTSTLSYIQQPSGHPFGWSNPTDWQATQDFLKSIDQIKATVDPTTLYTNQFVEAKP